MPTYKNLTNLPVELYFQTRYVKWSPGEEKAINYTIPSTDTRFAETDPEPYIQLTRSIPQEIISIGPLDPKEVNIDKYTDKIEIYNNSAAEITIYINDENNTYTQTVFPYTIKKFIHVVNKINKLILEPSEAIIAGQCYVTELINDVEEISLSVSSDTSLLSTVAKQDLQLAQETLIASALGSSTDAAISTDADGSMSGKLRGLVKWAAERMPVSIGQGTMAQSFPVVLPSDQTVSTVLTASEVHAGKVGGETALIDVTLSLDTNAYAIGDVLAEAQEVADAMRINGGTGTLQSIAVNSKDDQGFGFDLFFFSGAVTFGTENSAPSLSDADGDKFLARVPIGASELIDLGGTRVASKTGEGLGQVLKSAADSRSIYIAAMAQGAGTYSASGITLRLGILLD